MTAKGVRYLKFFYSKTNWKAKEKVYWVLSDKNLKKKITNYQKYFGKSLHKIITHPRCLQDADLSRNSNVCFPCIWEL